MHNQLFIASDHRGFEQKGILLDSIMGGKLVKDLKEGWEIIDLGPTNDERCDYPVWAKKVCQKMLNSDINGEKCFGILICGSGVGMSIAANKIDGIRCCLGYNKEAVIQARQHNDCNVLALSADNFKFFENLDLIKAFVSTEFIDKEPYISRISVLDLLN